MFQLKSRLIIHQHERDKEQTDHAMMLKELQGLVAEERNAKEQMQLQVNNAKRNYLYVSQAPPVSPTTPCIKNILLHFKYSH